MNKLALVTGGTRGIGKSICLELKSAGYTVVTNYISNELKARELTENFGIECIRFDISSFEACAVAVNQIQEKHGAISVLVNNAGIVRDNAFRNLAVEEWQEVINTNLGGPFNLCRLIFPEMIKANYGRIVNISSVVGQSGGYGQANYVASKAGIIGLTKTLAIEGARFNVTANVVAPGYIATDMLQDIPEKVMEKILAKIPAGRLGEPEEIARAVSFLVDQGSGFITGSTISINGGQYMV